MPATSFKVIDKKGGESRASANKAISEVLKGQPGNKIVIGKIGEDVVPESPQPVPTTEEMAEAKALRDFLVRCVEIPILSSRSTDLQNKRSFYGKLEKQSLSDLKRIWDKPIPEDMSDSDLMEVNRRFKDASI